MKLRNRRNMVLPHYLRSSSNLKSTQSNPRRSNRSVKKPSAGNRSAARLVGHSPIASSKTGKRTPSATPARRNRKKKAVEPESESENEEESEGDEEGTDDQESKSDPELADQPKSNRKSAGYQPAIAESQESSTATATQSQEQVQILLRRKMELGICNSSGRVIGPSITAVQAGIQNRTPKLQTPTAPPPRSIPIKPITQPSPIKDPIIPVSCPICYELFTTTDNAVRFEDHARVYHARFWLDQTRRGRPITPPITNSKKIENIDLADGYVPNCDVGRCVSCAARGIRCGFCINAQVSS